MDEFRPDEVQFAPLYDEPFSSDIGRYAKEIREKNDTFPLRTQNRLGRGPHEAIVIRDRVRRIGPYLKRIGVTDAELMEDIEVGDVNINQFTSSDYEIDWRSRVPPQILDPAHNESILVSTAHLAARHYPNEHIGAPPIACSNKMVLIESIDPHPMVHITPGHFGARLVFVDINSRPPEDAIKTTSGYVVEYDSSDEPPPISQKRMNEDGYIEACYFPGLGIMPLFSLPRPQSSFRAILEFDDTTGELLNVIEIDVSYISGSFEPDTRGDFTGEAYHRTSRAMDTIKEMLNENPALFHKARKDSRSERTASSKHRTGRKRVKNLASLDEIELPPIFTKITHADLARWSAWQNYIDKLIRHAKLSMDFSLSIGDMYDQYMLAYSAILFGMKTIHTFGYQISGTPWEDESFGTLREELYRICTIISLSPPSRNRSFLRLFYRDQNPFNENVGLCGRGHSKHVTPAFIPTPVDSFFEAHKDHLFCDTIFYTENEFRLCEPYFALLRNGRCNMNAIKKRIRATHIKRKITSDPTADSRCLCNDRQIDICVNYLKFPRDYTLWLSRWDRAWAVRKAASSLKAHKYLPEEMAIGYYREKAASVRDDVMSHKQNEFIHRNEAELMRATIVFRDDVFDTYHRIFIVCRDTSDDHESVHQSGKYGSAPSITVTNDHTDSEEDFSEFADSLMQEMVISTERDKIAQSSGFHSSLSLSLTNKKSKTLHPAVHAQRSDSLLTKQYSEDSVTMKGIHTRSIEIRVHEKFIRDIQARIHRNDRKNRYSVILRTSIVFREAELPIVRVRVYLSNNLISPAPPRHITTPSAHTAHMTSLSRGVYNDVPGIQFCQTPRDDIIEEEEEEIIYE